MATANIYLPIDRQAARDAAFNACLGWLQRTRSAGVGRGNCPECCSRDNCFWFLDCEDDWPTANVVQLIIRRIAKQNVLMTVLHVRSCTQRPMNRFVHS